MNFELPFVISSASPALMFIDLDGTLLDDEGKLSERSRSAIAAALQHHITVVIATGRNVPDTFHLFEEFCQQLYFVYYNGALIQHRNQTLRMAPLQPRQIESLTGFFNSELATPILYDPSGIRFIEPLNCKDHIFHEIYQRFSDRFTVVSSFSAILDSPILRVGIWSTEQRVEELFSKLQAISGEAYTMYRFDFSVWVLEVLAKQSNKGSALQWLANFLGIPSERTIAIGNHANDIDMIKAAGLGIAVANGLPEAKTAAKSVIPANTDDGVAQFIENLVSA